MGSTEVLIPGIVILLGEINDLGPSLYDLHDVGPSAGYYGCLGALIAASKLPYKKLIVAGALAILTLRMILSAKTMPESHAVLSADIVHLIAMLAGMAIRLTGFSIKRRDLPEVRE